MGSWDTAPQGKERTVNLCSGAESQNNSTEGQKPDQKINK